MIIYEDAVGAWALTILQLLLLSWVQQLLTNNSSPVLPRPRRPVSAAEARPYCSTGGLRALMEAPPVAVEASHLLYLLVPALLSKLLRFIVGW